MGVLPEDASAVSPGAATIHVAIIGGGIRGLCLAIGLLEYHHIDVQIYEAAPSFGEIGAGVAMGPNAQQALELIGPGTLAAFDKYATPNRWASHRYFWAQTRVVSIHHYIWPKMVVKIC